MDSDHARPIVTPNSVLNIDNWRAAVRLLASSAKVERKRSNRVDFFNDLLALRLLSVCIQTLIHHNPGKLQSKVVRQPLTST